MNIKNAFEVAKEMEALANGYNELAARESSEEVRHIYTEMTYQLDELQSKLLQISNYYPEDQVEKSVTLTREIEELPTGSMLTLLHAYANDNLALVEDEGMELYLVPWDALEEESTM
ncbi:hypothetical protein MNQ98_16195 [Paenibacillus sp. N3/727]|uniref:hypothetical protein n=1 Tax=Paenibacillus sp. N3/727 TaxID=2925845 RepID=UPI001F538BA5|nr:hypothetical protein [Paenibacillus sp. N3/727]UNK16078.1 hypothetical protein MNQ98_16195 [Paenibacillus sp. N3/727]